MMRRPTRSTRTDTLCPYTTRVRAAGLAHNPARMGKQLWTDSGEGEPVDLYASYNEVDEARFVVERIGQWVRDDGSHGDCAILYRSNAQSRVSEDTLLAEQIPYRVYGGVRFFEHAELTDTLAYLRRSEEHTSELQSLMRISYAVFCLKK